MSIATYQVDASDNDIPSERRTPAVPRTLLPMLLLLAACSAPPPDEPEPSGSDEPAPSASTLPALGLPGTRGDEPAGEYGWTGRLGSRAWMHRVIEDQSSPDGYRQTQLVFAVQDDCFPSATGAEPIAVTVAGLDGLYLEPYSGGDTQFSSSSSTGAYALAIGDRTLCVYLTWDPTTTQDELESARQVVESLRGQPRGPNGIRINFTLPARWDTG